ncbi:MAG: aldo/keto reductase [Pseudomonadota bacterium]
MVLPATAGYATSEGTARFRDRQKNVPKEHYRGGMELLFSDLGIGTYLGAHDFETDVRYTDAVVQAVENGVNAVDTAINYRYQRSERAIGEALRRLFSSGLVSRDEIVVATKGGYLSFDGNVPADPHSYFEETYIRPGILRVGEIAGGCHCIEPTYLRHELDKSLGNLGLSTVDIYYVHNAETQLESVNRQTFDRRLEAAFRFLEEEVEAGRIRRYGLATWDGFRVPPEARNYLSLRHVMEIAHRVAGDRHHFSAVQLPFNLMLREAALAPTQEWNGGRVSFFEVAQAHGLIVMGSVPLYQAKLMGKLPELLQQALGETRTDAQRAIAFAAAAPGLTTALVGMSRSYHVIENTAYLRELRLKSALFKAILDHLE